MPLPTTLDTPEQAAFSRVLATAQTVSSNLRAISLLLADGGPVTVENLIGLYMALNSAGSTGAAIQGVPGLADYAKQAMGDPNYDINAAFTTSVVACKAVTDWLLANLPNDGKGGYVGYLHQADGTISRMVTVDMDTLAPLIGLVNAALATFA